MPTKTNRALLELIAELMEQNKIGLITDWEAICAISLRVCQAQTPHEGDIDPSTGLRYTTERDSEGEPTKCFVEPDHDAEATAAYVNQDR